MDATGFKRMRRYLADNPPQSEMQGGRRIVGAFLDRYAIYAEIEEELDLPVDTGPDRADDADLRG